MIVLVRVIFLPATQLFVIAIENILQGVCGKSNKKLLKNRLNKQGYFESNKAPGLWTHVMKPILFTLVVGNFGIKYTYK